MSSIKVDKYSGEVSNDQIPIFKLRHYRQFLRRHAARAAGIVLALTHCSCEAFDGRVVAVHDGDTLTVLVAQQQVKVRLAGIDAPEIRQPFGTRSRQSLAQICHGKQATVAPTTRDRYGRTVGIVTCAGVDANASQVAAGMAWVYVKYAPKGSPLYRLEAEARAASLGLWADPSPAPPWEYRHPPRQ